MLEVFYRARVGVIGLLLMSLNSCQSADQPVIVSDLRVGGKFPVLQMQPGSAAGEAGGHILVDSLPAACRVVVYFDPECPHCAVAAERDANVVAPEFPVMWVTESDGPRLRAFQAKFAGRLTISVVPGAKSALKIRAVPVGFLVSRSDTVRVIFPHSGAVPANLLRPYCDEGVAGR